MFLPQSLKPLAVLFQTYRVQANGDLSTTNWNYMTGELSATKTNAAVVLYAGGINSQFYRVIQFR